MKRTTHLHTLAAENCRTVSSGSQPLFFALKKQFFLLFLLTLSWSVQLQAQLALKAKPLNVFIQPRQSAALDPDTIDVLSKSELSSCGVSSTDVRLFTGPDPVAVGTALHGNAGYDAIHKVITYKPDAGFIGQDSLKYSLTCGAQIDTAIVLINVCDKPEVIIEDACAVDPLPLNWSIVETSLNNSVSDRVHNYASLMVGDIDADGTVEIIGAMPDNRENNGNGITYTYPTEGINIYYWDETDKEIKLKNSFLFSTTGGVSCSTHQGAIAIARYDGDAYILVTGMDSCLYAYDPDGNRHWKSNAKYTPDARLNAFINIADFNNDGIPEIYTASDIFSLPTGNLLGRLPDLSNTTLTVAAVDMDGDGDLELIRGINVYDIDIQDYSNPNLNTVSLIAERSLSALPVGSTATILSTQVCDIDNDGILEVVTVSNIVYVWKSLPDNRSYVVGQYPTSTNDIPMIGNIDSDESLEIVFINAVKVDNIMYMYALDYDSSLPQGQQIVEKWRLEHTDGSGATGMTLFDFNQDGKSEIVYRDETRLRIINGEGAIPKILETFSNVRSSTLYEFPVIADIDKDGQAEIIVNGWDGTTSGGSGQNGYIRVFKSGGAPWAPARPVWNQYCYNPVYVNNDLTIPQYPLNPATRFVDRDGNYLQPFNNFRQQATQLNDEGKMLSYGPKLEYDNTLDPVIQYTDLIPSTSVNANFTVLNTGDADFKGPLYISVYFLNGSLLEPLQTETFGAGVEDDEGYIKKGESKNIVLLIDFGSLDVANPLSFFQIRLNDDGSGNPVSPLCSYFGTYSKPPFYAPDYFVRHGENTIYYYPPNSGYTYVWYDEYPNVEPKPDFVATGDSYSFTPAHTIEKFHVEVYNGTTLVELRPPVNTYLVPDSLIWTGNAAAGSQDWHNPENWEYPHDLDPEVSAIETARYKVPGVYTNVLIPGRLAASMDYPDLTAGKTVYSGTVPYTSALCDMVYFAHGGELLRTDLLSYSKACVNLTVQANRWYMFSPPLHSMYSGDFYRTTPNPFAASEQQTAYTMLYNAENPEVGGSYLSGNWTGVFNTPNRPLHPGSGIAVWIDKHGTDYDEHPEITLAFPKNDTAHYLYNPLRPAENNANISSLPMPTLRSHNGRFIYEGDDEKIAADGNITLQDMAGQQSGSVLVGNPFMAHLDFNEFYKANAAALGGSNQYKLAAGVDEDNEGVISTFYSYLWNESEQEYISTAPDYLPGNSSGRIPPMQAFIIDVTGGSVQANISHTVTSVAEVDTFRSATSASQSSGHLLQILATRGAAVSKTLILQGATYSMNYLPSEDSYKLFVSGMALDPETALDVLKPVQVYTRSSDGYALDINLIGTSEQDITVPLGIRTSEKGEIVLNFSGMESFGEETGIYLYDTHYPKRLIDLSTQPEYVFNKTEDTLYLENRLSLIIGKNTLARPLGFREVFSSSAVRIISRPHGTLRIISENDKALGNIRITDSWGRVLLDVPAVSSSVYEYQTPTPGIYIVRVGAEVKKVVSIQ